MRCAVPASERAPVLRSERVMPRVRPVSFILVAASQLCLGLLVACGHAWCPECPDDTNSPPASSQEPSSGSTGGGLDAEARSSGPLPACTWPATLDRPDSNAAGWWVSRTLLVCGDPDGGSTSVCESDSGTGTCDSQLRPCVMACGENQYLVMEEVQMPTLGSPDGGPYSPTLTFPTLPSACTSPSPFVASAEATYICCPCE